MFLPHPTPPQSSKASILGPERPPSGPQCQGCKTKGLGAEVDSPTASPDGPSPTCRTTNNKNVEMTKH